MSYQRKASRVTQPPADRLPVRKPTQVELLQAQAEANAKAAAEKAAVDDGKTPDPNARPPDPAADQGDGNTG